MFDPSIEHHELYLDPFADLAPMLSAIELEPTPSNMLAVLWVRAAGEFEGLQIEPSSSPRTLRETACVAL